MATLLVHKARLLVTMNDARESIPNGALFVRDHVIEWVGATADLPPIYAQADHIVDATDQVVLPGLVNTHHHLYQTLTRALAPNSGLFDWLKTLYPVWARMNGEACDQRSPMVWSTVSRWLSKWISASPPSGRWWRSQVARMFA